MWPPRHTGSIALGQLLIAAGCSLVLPLSVEDEVAQELASAGMDDPDLAVPDQNQDGDSGMLATDADVVKAAAVAHDDRSCPANMVGSDAVMGVACPSSGGGFGTDSVGGPWGGPAQ